jgi:hypothetical protein
VEAEEGMGAGVEGAGVEEEGAEEEVETEVGKVEGVEKRLKASDGIAAFA